MRYAGIDVAAERHCVAIVDDRGAVLKKPPAVSEEAAGYTQLRELLGRPRIAWWRWRPRATTGATCSDSSQPKDFRLHYSIRCALGALRKRTLRKPKPTRLTRWGLHASPPRGAPLRLHYRN